MKKLPVIADGLASIFSGIEHLKRAFPKKRFTIDGRLVGDIGEVIASSDFDIELFDHQVPGHDGYTSDDRLVQIKATFKKSLTFSVVPDYYLGLKLNEDGSYEVVYNGPGEPIAQRYAHRKGIGKQLLSFPISELRKLSAEVKECERIPKRKGQNGDSITRKDWRDSMDHESVENKRRQLAYTPPQVQALYHQMEAFISCLSPGVVQKANPKSYVGFYTSTERGSQFLQVKLQKSGLRIVLVPDTSWFDPRMVMQLDGGRTDKAYQNTLLRDEEELAYAFMLVTQAYSKKLGNW